MTWTLLVILCLDLPCGTPIGIMQEGLTREECRIRQLAMAQVGRPGHGSAACFDALRPRASLLRVEFGGQ